uniref:Large ribosomal subunit protein uL1c n=1 Tax=Spumella sp. Baekdong012001B8 TaxID=2782410 RepID=A0A7S6TC00_9STRA|nr:ribosomal protein L1 [Spumella sp. Baekdong012001B8]
MKKFSKRLQYLREIVGAKSYSLDNALSLLKKIATSKFDESVEAHISLNINPKYSNQQIKASVFLPHGSGKLPRIAVLTAAGLAAEAVQLGASIAGADDLLEEISKKRIRFDVLLTSASQMPKLTRFGRVLGPKGLMPSLASGTITETLKQSLDEFKKGKVNYRADKAGIVHLRVGKSSFLASQLKENLVSLYASIEKNKPTGLKGKYVKSFYICTTMSPSLKIDLPKY